MKLIVCVDENWGIGKNNSIPWDISEDKQFFKNITSANGPNALIMGRKTYESMPHSVFNENRIGIVLTSQDLIDSKFVFFAKTYLELMLKAKVYNNVFCIGGSELYKQCLINSTLEKIYVNQIKFNYNCNTFFPKDLLYKYTCISEKCVNNLTYYEYEYKVNEEFQYLELINDILINGNYRNDRTNTGIYSLFSKKLKFDLSKGFPLLTTKKVYFKGIVEELIWFMKGDTNVNHLIEKNVHIWDGNSTREYMDSIGIDREERDIGPCYGWQWRHFGANYGSMNDNYENKGFDQLKNVVETIKTNPNSRRIIMSAWSAHQVKDMNLPPCHVMYQFYVNDGKLSCQMYQRSADVFLGLPFNIGSCALLTHIIANMCNLNVGELAICIGDAHIYSNHITQCITQSKNTPYEFPTLNINRKLEFSDINNIVYEDFTLINYKSHGTIKAKMAV